MKKIYFHLVILASLITRSYGQTQVINVNNAAGDGPHLMLTNPSAAGFTNDTRATIWLDNDGRLKLRSVTGNGFAFRNTWNTGDILNITDFGMGIGTSYIPPGFQLAVNGNVIATSVTVKLKDNWPDYVFASTYRLQSLPALKIYLAQNHHLPEVPSAGDVANDGANLGEINRLLLKKVEELTLYLIEKDDEIKRQDNRIIRLEKLMTNGRIKSTEPSEKPF